MRARHAARGMTLLEILVSLGILGMISILIYGAFDSMARGKRGAAGGESCNIDGSIQFMLKKIPECCLDIISEHTAVFIRCVNFLPGW